MGKFEDQIKAAVSEYEVSYNANHWNKLKDQLPAAKATGGSMKYVAAAALVIGAAAITYFATQDETKSVSQPKQTIEQQETQSPSLPTIEPQVEEEQTPVVLEKQDHKPTTEVEKPTVTSAEKPAVKEEKSEEVVVEDQPIRKKVDPKTTGGLSLVINANTTQACQQDLIKFNAEVSEPATFLWNFGDGSSSELPNPVHRYKKAGKYAVSLEVTSIISGKSTKVFLDNPVHIQAKPIANFDHEIAPTKDFEQIVQLSTSAYNFQFASWQLDGKKFEGKQHKVALNKKGNYAVTLIVQNELGCYDTLVKNIYIANDYNLLAPNAFTPDNDGLNDVFLPKALENSSARYDLEIFDGSTGAMVHSSNQDNPGWNGLDRRTGVRADKGDYTWSIKLYKSNGEIEKFTGNLKLLSE